MAPKVTVVIPYYKDCAPFVQATVDSVLGQSEQNFGDFVLIVSEDGAECPVSVVCARNQLLFLEHKHNTGTYAALNRGIRAATGEYIAILAADDLLTPGSLGERASILDKYPEVVLVCGQAIEINETCALKTALKKSRPNVDPRRFYGPTIMMRRSLFEQYGYFSETLRWRQDREMWQRLFGKDYTRTDKGKFMCLNRVLGYRRMRSSSIQHRFQRLSDAEKARIEMEFVQATKEY